MAFNRVPQLPGLTVLCVHNYLAIMRICSLFYELIVGIAVVHGQGLWSSVPARVDDVIGQAYPVGNGRLGAMPFGHPGTEKVVLNIDSLWSGGPFQTSNYTGGNPTFPVFENLPGIRQWIFKNATGNMTGLLGSNDDYGSYQVYANLSVTIDGVTSATNYNRSLDLNTGVHTTTYTANDNNTYTTTIYCTYPDQVCVYDLSASNSLPTIDIALENQLVDPSLFNTTCGGKHLRLNGVTQLGPPTGMKYEGIVRLSTPNVTPQCSNATARALVILAESDVRQLTLVFGAGTNYDQYAGNLERDFSFRSKDSSAYVDSVTSVAASKSEADLRKAHITDYQSFMSVFIIDLPDSQNSSGLETSTIISDYQLNSAGDPYLESTLFSYGRHLFISSQRSNSLPANLAGRWSETLNAAWSADYHANINMQMNHWGVDQTGLGDLQVATWNYMENTWVPRGSETAKLLYNAPGWVTHDEMNVFGSTGMKDTAQWANYPASAAWMMQHVYDHYTYSQNATWYKEQGYPLLKGVAQFWVSQLQEDVWSGDGTLVVNPCNSPEHGPTTFACTHYQQLIHQIFTYILSSTSDIADLDHDHTFLGNITTALKNLDKGLHIGSWGEIKEWKLADSYGYDFQGDTHRHLSHLVGWYPGTSISGSQGGYRNATIQDAVRTSLISRGLGNGPDGDAGWEKVWRSACWAYLNCSTNAYLELQFAISENFASNGLSMYSAANPPFQIDANFGLVGAMLAMLVVDLGDGIVILGPAIPVSWCPGSVKGLRLRGGGSVDFSWDVDDGGAKGVVLRASLQGRAVIAVNVEGKVL